MWWDELRARWVRSWAGGTGSGCTRFGFHWHCMRGGAGRAAKPTSTLRKFTGTALTVNSIRPHGTRPAVLPASLPLCYLLTPQQRAQLWHRTTVGTPQLIRQDWSL